MKFINNQLLKIFFFLFFSLSFSQIDNDNKLLGEFTYLFQYKPNTLNPNHIVQELFTFQISQDKAFFISENKLKFDSIFISQFKTNKTNIDMRNFPNKPTSKFLIIQTSDGSNYYERIGRSVLFYNSPIIKDWKLSTENKKINGIECKKAEVRYKGRDWTAWYSTALPFPYGPYKFNGLPGLIIKITDKTGDYDFELVKSVASSNLKGMTVSVNKMHYEKAKQVTKSELIQARKNFRENIKYELENTGTTFSNKIERNRIDERDKKGYNPIELED